MLVLLHASAHAENRTHRTAGEVVIAAGVVALVASGALYLATGAGSFGESEFGPLPREVGPALAAPYLYTGSALLLTTGMPLFFANGDGEPHRDRMLAGAVLTCVGVSAMVAGVVYSIVPLGKNNSDPTVFHDAGARNGWAGMGITVMGNAAFAAGLPLLADGFGKKRVYARGGGLAVDF